MISKCIPFKCIFHSKSVNFHILLMKTKLCLNVTVLLSLSKFNGCGDKLFKELYSKFQKADTVTHKCILHINRLLHRECHVRIFTRAFQRKRPS